MFGPKKILGLTLNLVHSGLLLILSARDYKNKKKFFNVAKLDTLYFFKRCKIKLQLVTHTSVLSYEFAHNLIFSLKKNY